LVVGRLNEPDAQGTADWKKYLNSRALSRVWGPKPNSPWMPFHCLTLLVALDYLRLEKVGPCIARANDWTLRGFSRPAWIDSGTLLLVDLPGTTSVKLGAALAASGCDLVCTFNNWPHPLGLIRAEDILAAMLRYASWLDQARTAQTTPGPVAWLCDADRLGTRPGRPDEFDNRYYIEDGVMPGPNFLKAQGISKVIYLSERPEAINADIGVHLNAYKKDGLQVAQASVSDKGVVSDPWAFNLTPKAFSTTGFFRSSAGGFGAPVPHPSSGG